jgi:hypothetical protein
MRLLKIIGSTLGGGLFIGGLLFLVYYLGDMLEYAAR